MTFFKSLFSATAIAATFIAASASAQTYPERSITMVVPFAAGGPTDTVARLVAESMSKDLGQQVLVENVGGAGGTLGAGRVASSEPDGYTILLHHIGMATSASLYRKLAYDPLNAFDYVGLVTDVPMTIVARKDFEPTDLKGLVESLGAGLELSGARWRAPEAAEPHLHPGVQAHWVSASGELLATVGQLHPSAAKRLDCDAPVFVAEIALDALLSQPVYLGKHRGLAKFPAVMRDFALVQARERERPAGSYTTSLFEGGVRRAAQKVGEEGVETALAAVAQDDAALLGEAADLAFHLLVLLRSRGLGLADVEAVLRDRHAAAAR